MAVMEEVDPGKDIIKGIPKVPGLLWRVVRAAVPGAAVGTAIYFHGELWTSLSVVASLALVGLIGAASEDLEKHGASC